MPPLEKCDRVLELDSLDELVKTSVFDFWSDHHNFGNKRLQIKTRVSYVVFNELN